jgi:hypothetical protein
LNKIRDALQIKIKIKLKLAELGKKINNAQY